MPNYTVTEAQQVRQLPGKPEKNWPAKWVDHLTLKANGGDPIAVTAFRKLEDPLPTIGAVIEGEVGEQDSFDKDRRKFKAAWAGKGGGGFRKRDPAETARIERMHHHEMAIRVVAIKAQLGVLPAEPNGKQNFDLADVFKICDAFARDLEPDAPKGQTGEWVDDGGLPPA